MAKMSENAEATIVGVGTACEAIAGIVATQPLPLEVKALVGGTAAIVGTALLAFWKGYVNKPTST